MDDVTQDKPLNGGRQRANHIQVHRVELGMWERKHLGKPLAKLTETTANMEETVRIAKTVAIVGASGAMVALSYVAYKVGKTLYGWADDIYDNFKDKEEGLRWANSRGGFGPISGLTKIFGIFQEDEDSTFGR